MTIHPDVLQVAHSVLTPKQLEAWELETQGYSIRAIAFRLDIAKSTATDRIDSAHRRLRQAGVRMTTTGSYYLEETA